MTVDARIIPTVIDKILHALSYQSIITSIPIKHRWAVIVLLRKSPDQLYS